jgi:hypothetical protein
MKIEDLLEELAGEMAFYDLLSFFPSTAIGLGDAVEQVVTPSLVLGP